MFQTLTSVKLTMVVVNKSVPTQMDHSIVLVIWAIVCHLMVEIAVVSECDTESYKPKLFTVTISSCTRNR